MLLDVAFDALTTLAQEEGWSRCADVMLRHHDVREGAAWESALQAALQRFGRIDYLFNIAGVLRTGYVHSMPLDELTIQLDVNTRGVLLGTAVAARHMVRQKSGHVINVASIAALSHVPGLAGYCASKHAVRGFSLAAAHELREHGVSVSVFCPDAVETPMLTAQESAPSAAMTFGGGRALTLVEVEHALWKVMRTRPLELVLDVPYTGRAWAARASNLVPQLARLGLAHVQRRGRAAQHRRKLEQGEPS